MEFLGDHIKVQEVIKNGCKELLQLKFETINICNIRCDFCRTAALTESSEQEKSMKIGDFRKIINEAIDLGLQIVSFEGKGEPFLDLNFLSYLDYLKSKELYIKIHSNLTILNKVSNIKDKEKFLELIQNYKKISLVTTLVYKKDKERITHHLKTLKTWGYLSNDKTRLAARILIFKNNMGEIKKYFRFCIKNNIYPRVQLFYNLGRAVESTNQFLSKKELKVLYKELEVIKKECNCNLELPPFPGYKAFPLYYTLCVDSNKNIKFYPEFDVNKKWKNNFLGNLNNKNLKVLWNSKKAIKTRAAITYNTGKCSMCPQKRYGCYGDRIQSIIMCGGEFNYNDIYCWYNETENRNLPQQIIGRLNKELSDKIGKNILTIGIFNDWEKFDEGPKKIKNLKEKFDEGIKNFRLSYVLPYSLEESVISSMHPKFIKAFLKTKKYIFGKKNKDFSTILMKSSTNGNPGNFERDDWATDANGKLKKGIMKFEQDIFQDFSISDSDKAKRNVMFVSVLKHKKPVINIVSVLKHKKPVINKPFGLIFITLPKSYLQKEKSINIKELLDQKVEEYSNYLYKTILKSWSVKLSSILDENIEKYQNKEAIELEVTNILYCAFLLANINNKDANKYFTYYENNEYNYFIDLNDFLKTFPFSLGDFIYDLIKLKIQTINRWERIQALKEQAKKSAIAAVMSRNMSHNFGSHSLVNIGSRSVLDKLLAGNYNDLKSQLGIETNEHSTVYGKERFLLDFRFFKINEINEKQLKDNGTITSILLSEYFANLRIRMDLIADIVTSVPTSENVRNLKDDVISKFTNNYLLADTISGINDFKYSIKVDNNTSVSIPNDSLGMDVFSILIENIIRNTTKHNSIENTTSVNYTINTEDLDDFPDYIKVTIYDNLRHNSALVKQLNENINRTILEGEKHQLRKGAWGMLEMKVAASYLRKIPTEEIDNEEFRMNPDADGSYSTEFNIKGVKKIPHILKAFSSTREGSVGGLGYSFFLMKPREILVFDFESTMQRINAIKPALLRKGIQVVQTEGKIIEKLSRTIYNHKVLLCVSSNNKKKKARKEIIMKYSPSLPNRIIWREPDLKIGDQLPISKMRIENSDLFTKTVWDLWDSKYWENLKHREIEQILVNGIKARNVNVGKKNTLRLKISNHGDKFSPDSDDESFKKVLVEIGTGFSKSKFPFKSHDNDFHKSFLEERNSDNKKIINLFLESYTTRIGIIDERIQSFSEQDYHRKDGKPIKYNEVFEKMNVLIPPNRIDLKSKNFINNKIGKKLDDWIKYHAKNLDFLLIHLGIIEKIIDSNEKKKIEKYLSDIDKQKKKELPDLKLIVLSGRGKPPNLPGEVRFLNYSQVAYYTCDNQSKYMLTDLCFSSRNLKK